MEQTHNNIKYKFFWGSAFSNWYPCTFTMDGINYNCSEQYMMYQKAIIFGDDEVAKRILEEENPRFQKELGRVIKGFDPKIWDAVKYEVVKAGVYEKFKQNEDIKQELLNYKDYQFVEASPHDRIWGIGYYDREAIANIDNWGENLLGKILTEVAHELS